MASRRGRRTALVAAAIAIGAIAAAAAVYREDLMVRYHVFRLRRDPAYISAIAGYPVGTPARRAIAAFLAETIPLGTTTFFLDLPDGEEGERGPAGIPGIGKVEEVGLERYLEMRSAGNLEREELRGGWIYFSSESRVSVHLDKGTSAMLILTERYKARLEK